ncbi:MAG: RsmE family RNA methyltransferase [Gemmatimonadales bacterium]
MRVLVERGGCPPGGWEAGKRVSLEKGEAHHLRVRRAKTGEMVEVLDGAGLRATGALVQTGKEWWVEVRDAVREPRPAELTLAVAAGDKDRFSWMVEKAAELGVTAVVPLETTRSAAVATGLRGTHLLRIRRQALEATKQCGAAWAVRVEEPVSLPAFLERPAVGLRWVADHAGIPVAAQLDAIPLTIVIGPEGGLTAEERGSLLAAGYQPVALGPHTLRFETAALAAAAAASIARMRGNHG